MPTLTVLTNRIGSFKIPERLRQNLGATVRSRSRSRTTGDKEQEAVNNDRAFSDTVAPDIARVHRVADVSSRSHSSSLSSSTNASFPKVKQLVQH